MVKPLPEDPRLSRSRRKRFFIGALAVGLPLLVLSLDTGLRLGLGWRPTPGIERRSTAVVGLGSVVWLVALSVPAVRSAVRRRWAALVLLSGMALFVWGAVELGWPAVAVHRRVGNRVDAMPTPTPTSASRHHCACGPMR